jgi:glycolate oxidase
LVKELRRIVGKNNVITRRESLLDYLVDETASTVCPKPSSNVILVKPETTQEISKILRMANEFRIHVCPRGGGTGLVGGCIPVQGGIVLSLERLNKVIEVDTENMMAVVESGVTLDNLIRIVEDTDLSFPPHPGDEAAHIGGLVACNAGGARAVRYGIMRNYIKGVEVVLPTSETLNLGGKLLKDVAGYNLMHLIIGSQGTLGIITKVILRLYPKFQKTATLIILYEDHHDALRTVPKLIRMEHLPLAIEYVERELMDRTSKLIGKRWPVKEGKTCLLIIVTGKNKEEIYRQAERIDEIANENNSITTLIVESKNKQNDILDIRSKIYFTLKPFTMDITDVAVPIAKVPDLVDDLDRIAKKFNTYLPTFGHAGDGNLHTHILVEEVGGVKEDDLDKVKKEIYDATIMLGGTITAEHGVGKIRIKNLYQHSEKKAIEIMKDIKRVFDPNNILNPGTIISY